MDVYYDKYLKYKLKYNKLKEMKGGAVLSLLNIAIAWILMGYGSVEINSSNDLFLYPNTILNNTRNFRDNKKNIHLHVIQSYCHSEKDKNDTSYRLQIEIKNSESDGKYRNVLILGSYVQTIDHQRFRPTSPKLSSGQVTSSSSRNSVNLVEEIYNWTKKIILTKDVYDSNGQKIGWNPFWINFANGVLLRKDNISYEITELSKSVRGFFVSVKHMAHEQTVSEQFNKLVEQIQAEINDPRLRDNPVITLGEGIADLSDISFYNAKLLPCTGYIDGIKQTNRILNPESLLQATRPSGQASSSSSSAPVALPSSSSAPVVDKPRKDYIKTIRSLIEEKKRLEEEIKKINDPELNPAYMKYIDSLDAINRDIKFVMDKSTATQKEEAMKP